MSSALTGIDQINWADYGHAYGKATDIPGLLVEVTDNNQKIRDSAYSSLYNNLRHQGSLCSAAAVTAPFLLQLLADPLTPERHRVLGLVTHLAVGYDEEWLPEGIPIAEIRRRLPKVGSESAELSPEQQEWVDWVTAIRGDQTRGDRQLPWTVSWSLEYPEQAHEWLECYDAVAAGVPLFGELLQHEDRRVRAEAAYAVGWFGEQAHHTVPALCAALNVESDPLVAASMLISLGLLADVHDDPTIEVLQGFLSLAESWRSWRRWGAAVALTILRRRGAQQIAPERDGYVIGELVRGVHEFVRPEPPSDDSEDDWLVEFDDYYVWPQWLFGDLRGLSALCLARLGPLAAPRAMSAVGSSLSHVGVWDGKHLTEALLLAANPHGMPQRVPRRRELSLAQQQALAALYSADEVRGLMNTESYIEAYQLSCLLPRLNGIFGHSHGDQCAEKAVDVTPISLLAERLTVLQGLFDDVKRVKAEVVAAAEGLWPKSMVRVDKLIGYAANLLQQELARLRAKLVNVGSVGIASETVANSHWSLSPFAELAWTSALCVKFSLSALADELTMLSLRLELLVNWAQSDGGEVSPENNMSSLQQAAMLLDAASEICNSYWEKL